ncbi:hypothetical protein AG0111_0g11504 [Alternaria gaisen]|uniref:Uncharacterized protein n=1 Tax=Alternaria gaisen TaxID=167740 RepID=A0ACB6F7D0_9PLEO|nr:hypothetical protein AG0111_0g11504 [Alternaria gaisen]
MAPPTTPSTPLPPSMLLSAPDGARTPMAASLKGCSSTTTFKDVPPAKNLTKNEL